MMKGTEKEYTLEDVVKTMQDLPGRIAEEVSKVSLYTTTRPWCGVVKVRLDKIRSSPELILSHPEGGDCIVALPDSTGNAIIHLDSPTAYGYAMRTVYRKVGAPFQSLYVQNAAQPGAFLFLALGRGDITIERWP